MKYKPEWSHGKKTAYHAARNRYHKTGTKEALTDKISDMKKMLRRWKETDVNEDKIAEIEAAVTNWAAKRDEV